MLWFLCSPVVALGTVADYMSCLKFVAHLWLLVVQVKEEVDLAVRRHMDSINWYT